jgi:nanoRNase/pAp phosphatase (c-di-AMP/oligoRNAs hydrolase)
MPTVGVVEDLREALPAAVDDEVVLVAAVAVVVLVGFGLVIYWQLRTTTGQTFADVLGGHDAVAVLMHADPDPDAMAAALAVSELAGARDTSATAYYPGEIRHHENRAFETVLDADFERIEKADAITEDAIVLVDHNEPRGMPGAESLSPVAVVDHHPGDGTGTEFTDVRPETGACATILAEYFDTLGWDPVDPDADADDDELSTTVATGLVFGIHADTNSLTNGCTEAEFEAIHYLFPGLDSEIHERLHTPPMDAETLDVKARAITERDVRSPFAVSDVGTVSNSDSIPQAADELKCLESVSAVVVMGDKDGTIRLAGRSDDDRVHMGNLLHELVTDISPALSAGGHARMGGGRIPVEHLEPLGRGEELTREDLREQLFDAMNGEL